MVTVASDNPFPSVLLVEGDPEALAANPAAGQRRLAVGADHLLYLVDDAGAATLVGTTPSEILAIPTAELDDSLVLAPDGAGGVEWVTPASGFADPMTTRGDIIIRNAANATARLAKGANGTALVSDGTDVAYGTPYGALLAHKAGAGSDSTTTSTSMVDADATNLAVAFTAPASGKVLVRLTSMMSPSAGGSEAVGTVTSWGLRESSSNIAGAAGGTIVARVLVAGGTVTDIRYCTAAFILTGVSAGSHTYKWSFATSAGTTKIYNTTAVMEVIALV